MENDAIRNRYWCCGARITEPHPPGCPTITTENRCPVCHVHTRCEHGEWMERLQVNENRR